MVGAAAHAAGLQDTLARMSASSDIHQVIFCVLGDCFSVANLQRADTSVDGRHCLKVYWHSLSVALGQTEHARIDMFIS